MHYDNQRGRHEHGFDAGAIVDGVVTMDPSTGLLVLVDEDGVGFDPQAALLALAGKRIRMTIVSFDAMQDMADLLRTSAGGGSA